MKKLKIAFCATALLTVAFSTFAQQNDTILHIQRYLGNSKVSETDLSQRNIFYWSVGTETEGKGMIRSARQVTSSGVAQADFRICTYEDGSPIFENGKYFICASSRAAGIGSTVYSYDINTSDFTLVGALQGYDKEGTSKALIAPHLIYNREDGYWYVFAHWGSPHTLCVGKTLRDPRYGCNELVTRILKYEDPVPGDEDNFVYYDKEVGKWVLVYSRQSTFITKQYGDSIDGEYSLICGTSGIRSLTGINVARVGGKKYMVSGFGNKEGADGYKVFDFNDLSYVCDLNLDIPTGGWRGWGTLLSIIEGDATKYVLLTFDRINPLGFSNWNYGNIYLYEAVERNSGCEFDIRRPEGTIIKADAGDDFGPADLHFRKRFTKRLNFSQEIHLGELDLSSRIFLEYGNPYPTRDSVGVTRAQTEKGIEVKGHGKYSLLAGSHIPGAEYVLDLTEMQKGEARYLTIGTLDKDVATISFRRSGKVIKAYALGNEVLSFPSAITHIRMLTSGDSVFFIDATPASL